MVPHVSGRNSFSLILYIYIIHKTLYTVHYTLTPFSPDHLIHYARVALYDFDHLGGDILVHIVGHGDTMIASGIHGDGGVYGLQQGVLVDACDEEAGLV